MSESDTESRDDSDLEYAEHRVAEVVERAAKANSHVAGLETASVPESRLRSAHVDLCKTFANTRRAISRVERALIDRADGHGRTMPREITDAHSDRLEETYDEPVYYLAIQLLERNRREFLYAKPDSYGAEQVERHGLTENQRTWLNQLQDAWDAYDGGDE